MKVPDWSVGVTITLLHSRIKSLTTTATKIPNETPARRHVTCSEATCSYWSLRTDITQHIFFLSSLSGSSSAADGRTLTHTHTRRNTAVCSASGHAGAPVREWRSSSQRIDRWPLVDVYNSYFTYDGFMRVCRPACRCWSVFHQSRQMVKRVRELECVECVAEGKLDPPVI